MSRFTSIAKRLSINTKLYRPARWLEMHIRPHHLKKMQEDIELYSSLIPFGTLCFDVGANIGEKSVALLTAGAQVVSFEPNPELIPELIARCGNQKEWTIVQCALGSGASISTLNVCDSHCLSSLADNWGGNVITEVNVPVVTLDSAIQRFGVPYFCKIDVEGWEIEVLRGLTQPIPLISFEFNLEDRYIQNTVSCLEKLHQFGVAKVNITPAESSAFYFDKWVPLDRFIEWFPGDLNQALTSHRYGDVFVRNDLISNSNQIT